MAARRLNLDINFLMSIAVIGAMYIGEWAEAATVFFFFSLSEFLETLSVARTRREIRALLDLSPQTAMVKTDEEFRELPVEKVRIGETVLVKAGARLPLRFGHFDARVDCLRPHRAGPKRSPYKRRPVP